MGPYIYAWCGRVAHEKEKKIVCATGNLKRTRTEWMVWSTEMEKKQRSRARDFYSYIFLFRLGFLFRLLASKRSN